VRELVRDSIRITMLRRDHAWHLRCTSFDPEETTMGQQQNAFETIDINTLATVGGGQAQQQGAPQGGEDEGPPRRTWGQVARQYGAACVSGAGQALMFGGRPRNWRQGLGTAAMGCATGVAMRAVDDVSQAVGGE
jgi:hypothetical protein